MGWGAAGRGERTSEIGQPVKGEGGAQNFGHSPKGGRQIMGGSEKFLDPSGSEAGPKFFHTPERGVIDFFYPSRGGVGNFLALVEGVNNF